MMMTLVNHALWIIVLSGYLKLVNAGDLVATIEIVEDVADLIEENCLHLENQVKSCLQQSGINYLTVDGLLDLFTTRNENVVPFSHLMTHHQQLSYYGKHYNLIVSFEDYIANIICYQCIVMLGSPLNCFKGITHC